MCMHMLSRVRLCDCTDSSSPGSSVHGIFEARTLEWAAISYPRGPSQPRDWNHVSCVSCTGSRILQHCTNKKVVLKGSFKTKSQAMEHWKFLWHQHSNCGMNTFKSGSLKDSQLSLNRNKYYFNTNAFLWDLYLWDMQSIWSTKFPAPSLS